MEHLNNTNEDLHSMRSYRFWTEDNVRFADLDPMNHLNNVASAVYCEAGRADFVTNLWPDCINGKGLNWVIVNINLTYHTPVFYPAKVMIGTQVLNVGKSSVSIAQGLFTKQQCFATAVSSIVWFDTETNSSSLLSDDMVQVLQTYRQA